MAGKRTSDQFDLWMPGLAGVDQIASDLYGPRQTAQRACDEVVVGEQLIEA